MLTDISVALDKIEAFKKHMPKVGVYYAIKSNSNPDLVRAIDPLVDGYDIASLGEFNQLCDDVKVDPYRILYSNPVKIPSHIRESVSRHVKYFAFDSMVEIEKLSKYAPGANVYLRVRVSDYGSKFPLSKKFGVDPIHVLAYASMAVDAGLNFCGLAFHVGSQSENPKMWDGAFELVGRLIKKLARHEIRVDFINIGGGFPADYGEPIPSIEEIAKHINQSIDQYIPPNIRIVAEPGRYISANTSLLVAEVIGREHRSGADWLYIDMGVFQGLMESLEMENWKYPIFTEQNPKQYRKNFILTGPTCDAYDTLGTEYELPASLGVGDKIYIGSAGAYTVVYSSNFNGFSPPKVFNVRL